MGIIIFWDYLYDRLLIFYEYVTRKCYNIFYALNDN